MIAAKHEQHFVKVRESCHAEAGFPRPPATALSADAEHTAWKRVERHVVDGSQVAPLGLDRRD